MICLQASLPPTPDIQADFYAARDWQTSMDRLLQSSALIVEVQPKYSCSLPRLKRNALPTVVAIHKLTPSAVFLRVQHRELCSATLASIADVDHECRTASRVAARRAPVVVLRVVARDVIALSPESFDERIARPSLECESTGFDALYQWRTRDKCFVGLADFVIGSLNATVEDGARLPFVFTALISSACLYRISVANMPLPQLDQGICFLSSEKAVNVYHQWLC